MAPRRAETRRVAAQEIVPEKGDLGPVDMALEIEKVVLYVMAALGIALVGFGLFVFFRAFGELAHEQETAERLSRALLEECMADMIAHLKTGVEGLEPDFGPGEGDAEYLPEGWDQSPPNFWITPEDLFRLYRLRTGLESLNKKYPTPPSPVKSALDFVSAWVAARGRETR